MIASRNPIAALIEREKFTPTALGLVLNPFYTIRRKISISLFENSKKAQGRLLDFGCGSSPYKSYFSHCERVGLDVAGTPEIPPDVTLYDGRTIPFPDSSFNSILASEVLEHVPDLQFTLSELYRVAAPGAVVLVTIPFLWPEHEAHDFRRLSCQGLRTELERAGFQVENIVKLGGPVSSLAQLGNVFWVDLFASWPAIPRRFFLATLTIPLKILGLIASCMEYDDSKYYLGSSVVARRKS